VERPGGPPPPPPPPRLEGAVQGHAGSAGPEGLPGISAQSTQQLIGEFCEAVESCQQLRKNGQTEARYPWRKPRYHDVVYTNQDARIRDGRLVLPHCTSGTLRIRLPKSITLPGRLMEVRLSFGIVRLVFAVPDTPRPQQTVIGVDLGVNTLIAATDGVKGRCSATACSSAASSSAWSARRIAASTERAPSQPKKAAKSASAMPASATCQLIPSHHVTAVTVRALVAVSPAVPTIFALLAFLRFLTRMDELQRRIQLEALGFAFGVTAILTFAYGFLENAGCRT
jgi:hypothetical protein